jgi:hypothetical protein
MNANFSATESKNRQTGGIFREKNRLTRKRDMIQERVAAVEREMKMREMENARIEKINEQIFRIHENQRAMAEAREFKIEELKQKGATDFCVEVTELREETERGKKSAEATIAMLGEQINKIHETRAEREQAAIEREIVLQQREMEERMRERERVAQENKFAGKTQEELEADHERSAIRNLTMMSVRAETIGLLSQTRARISAEETRMQIEANFDKQRVRIANVQDTFTGRHARIDANINLQIGAMYRDSQKMQEEQLRISREKTQANPKEERDENDDAYENFSVDLRL